MVEYALVSGQSIQILMGTALAPLTKLYAKVGLSLSVAETGFVTLILVGLIIVSLYHLLATKR